jgi:hypothetical protein
MKRERLGLTVVLAVPESAAAEVESAARARMAPDSILGDGWVREYWKDVGALFCVWSVLGMGLATDRKGCGEAPARRLFYKNPL